MLAQSAGLEDCVAPRIAVRRADARRTSAPWESRGSLVESAAIPSSSKPIVAAVASQPCGERHNALNSRRGP